MSGTESDSDSFLSPDHSPHATSATHFSVPHHVHTLAPSSSTTKHLSAIAERRSGSDGEETEEDEEDELDGEEWQRGVSKSFEVTQRLTRQSHDSDCAIKTGYLGKKGERRKVRPELSSP